MSGTKNLKRFNTCGPHPHPGMDMPPARQNGKQHVVSYAYHSIMPLGHLTDCRLCWLAVIPVIFMLAIKVGKRGARGAGHNGNEGGWEQEPGEVVNSAQDLLDCFAP